MSGPITDFRDDEPPVRLTGAEAAFFETAARQVARRIRKHDPRRVIDMEVHRPDEHRTAEFIGHLIGTAFFGGIVHVVLAGRRIAQAIGHRAAALRPKEAS